MITLNIENSSIFISNSGCEWIARPWGVIAICFSLPFASLRTIWLFLIIIITGTMSLRICLICTWVRQAGRDHPSCKICVGIRWFISANSTAWYVTVSSLASLVMCHWLCHHINFLFFSNKSIAFSLKLLRKPPLRTSLPAAINHYGQGRRGEHP